MLPKIRTTQPQRDRSMTPQPQDRELQSVEQRAQGDAKPSSTSAAEAAEPQGLRAGPGRMVVAGLLAGLVAWTVFDHAFPFWKDSMAPGPPPRPTLGPPPGAEIGNPDSERNVHDLKNSIAAGAALGVLAGLVFSFMEGFQRPRRRFVAARIVLGVLLAAGFGALAGFAAQEFYDAWKLDLRLEPMQRTMAMQGIFWGLVAVGVGLGLGLFAQRFSLVLGTVLQVVMSMALFVIVYVVLAGVLFPIDDAERLVPDSSGNRALWCFAAMTLLGLFLGLARRRRKALRSSPMAAT